MGRSIASMLSRLLGGARRGQRAGAQRVRGLHAPPPHLDSVVHLSLLQNEDPSVVINIWKDFHTSKPDTVAAVMPREHYKKFATRTRNCPLFVLPIARGEGFLTLIMQHQA